jgi:hypothetical protein
MKLLTVLGLSALTLALVPTVTAIACSPACPAPVVVQGGGSKLGTAMEEPAAPSSRSGAHQEG